jgi:hypothetical protein
LFLYFQVLAKNKYLCMDHYDEAIFDFHCVDIRYLHILNWIIFLIHIHKGPGWLNELRSLDLTAHTSLSPIRRGFAPSFVNYKKGCTWLAATSDKVYCYNFHKDFQLKPLCIQMKNMTRTDP